MLYEAFWETKVFDSDLEALIKLFQARDSSILIGINLFLLAFLRSELTRFSLWLIELGVIPLRVRLEHIVVGLERCVLAMVDLLDADRDLVPKLTATLSHFREMVCVEPVYRWASVRFLVVEVDFGWGVILMYSFSYGA